VSGVPKLQKERKLPFDGTLVVVPVLRCDKSVIFSNAFFSIFCVGDNICQNRRQDEGTSTEQGIELQNIKK
jgi:hypothetical protein